MTEEQVTAAPVEEDFKDKYLRALAETENMRKRMQKEKQDMLRFGIENVVADFIPAIDNFENALKFAANASPEVQNWAKGFEMMLGQLKEVLTSNGITSFSSVGTMFDPELHEAVETEETNEQPDGTIVHEFTKGYKSDTRTLRAARVKVAKNTTQEGN
jgi:molecular chaperone GrpE